VKVPKAPDCLACSVPMKPGVLTDAAYVGIFRSRWREVDSKNRTTARELEVHAFRCPQCGVIHLYSPPKKWNKVD
jgi:hypothetical protein